jgi:hypothetical protein
MGTVYALSALVGFTVVALRVWHLLDLRGKRDVFAIGCYNASSCRSDQLPVGGIAAEAEVRTIRRDLLFSSDRRPDGLRWGSHGAGAMALGFFGSAGSVAGFWEVTPSGVVFVALIAAAVGYAFATYMRFLRRAWD